MNADQPKADLDAAVADAERFHSAAVAMTPNESDEAIAITALTIAVLYMFRVAGYGD